MKYTDIRKEAERRVEAGAPADMKIFDDGFQAGANGSPNFNPYRVAGILTVESAIWDLGVEAAFIGMLDDDPDLIDEFDF